MVTHIDDTPRDDGDAEPLTLIAGEAPLLVFISSVMRPELEPEVALMREKAVRIFRATGFLRAWAFEYTPGSSERVDQGYLRKVREADLVLWLVRREITAAVANEVREAVAGDRPLLVVRLPTDSRSDATRGLLAEVGLYSKRVDVDATNALEDVLSQTIGDEIVRAMRRRPSLGRIGHLEELGRASRGRCIERWRANGVPLADAVALFADPSLGALGTTLQAGESHVSLVIGDMGAGKSLIGERFLQAAIAKAATHADAPVPYYGKAYDLGSGLQATVTASAAGIGNPRTHGATIFIDGLDEAGIGAADRIYREACVLAATWPNTAILLTSRPLPIYNDADGRVFVQPLDRDESLALIGRAAHRELSSGLLSSWPQSVQDAASRPFFAILLGVLLRTQDTFAPRSTGMLLDALVERALGRETADNAAANSLLKRLAVLSTDRDGAAVPSGEVGVRAEVSALLPTRLVVEHDRALSFPLPLLTQWFAAQSLVDGAVTVDDLLGDPRRLERWRYPLVILAGTMGHEVVSRSLAPIVEQSPAFASQIVHDAVARWGGSGAALPPSDECGRRIRGTMASWTRGIGPLATLIAPVRDGPPTLAVWARDGELTTSWYRGPGTLPDVVDFGTHYRDETSDWLGWRSSSPAPQSSWAWRWTFDELSANLSRLMERRALPIAGGPLASEFVWRLMNNLMRCGSLSDSPVEIEKVEHLLSRFPDDVGRAIVNGRMIDPRAVRGLAHRMRADGMTAVHPPWPGPDRTWEEAPDNLVWSCYSDSRLLARTRAVYAGAVEGYQQLVAAWFPAFASRLQTAATLPARLVGDFIPARTELGFAGGPTLRWHFEPLPQGAASTVDIRHTEGTEAETRVAWQDGGGLRALFGRLRSLRPNAAPWIAATNQWSALDIYEDTPATTLAYAWLTDDLKRAHWL